jgi:hypothetical protein
VSGSCARPPHPPRSVWRCEGPLSLSQHGAAARQAERHGRGPEAAWPRRGPAARQRHGDSLGQNAARGYRDTPEKYGRDVGQTPAGSCPANLYAACGGGRGRGSAFATRIPAGPLIIRGRRAPGASSNVGQAGDMRASPKFDAREVLYVPRGGEGKQNTRCVRRRGCKCERLCESVRTFSDRPRTGARCTPCEERAAERGKGLPRRSRMSSD